MLAKNLKGQWDKTCTTRVVPFCVGGYTFWKKQALCITGPPKLLKYFIGGAQRNLLQYYMGGTPHLYYVIYGRSLMIFRKEKVQTSLLVTFLLIFNSWAGAVCTTNNTSCGGSIPCICGLVLTWNSTFTAAYWQNDGLVLTSSIICQDFKKEDGSFERSSASQHSGNDVREATKKIGKMKDLVLKRGGWVQES